MIRRLLIPILGSGLLLGVTAGSALAKCEPGAEPTPAFCGEIIVTLDVAGGGMLQAGTRETLAVNVSQGERPFAAVGVALTFLDADGTRVRAPGTATSAGNWTADVTLPDGGSWSVVAQVVDLNGGAYRLPVNTAWGTVLPALPPAKTPVTAPPVTPASPVLPIALTLGLLAAAALAGQVIRDRSRRRTAATGVASGSAATADRA